MYPDHRDRRRYRFEFLVLEPRILPSGFAPTYVPFQRFSHFAPADGTATPYPGSFGPAQIDHGYGIDAISFNGVAGTGAGQTIAIIGDFDNPDLSSSTNANFVTSDLHTFDLQYGLPEPTGFFTKVNQTGGVSYPGVDPTGGWEGEAALDVEWAHAIAPQANILLVEANNSNSLVNAIQWAKQQSSVSVISMSWGGNEFAGETAADSYFLTPNSHQGITFIASSGDFGSPGLYPAYSPNVIAVGGTNLTLNTDFTYGSESAWPSTGGGTSAFEAEPTYQQSVQSSGHRTIPDVAFDGNPFTGVSVCDSYNYGASTPWWELGGTSLGAPCWAGLIAIANQGRVINGFGTLNGATQTLPKLYSMSAANFHDITTGSNGFAASPGYDLVTGRGTPIADLLVPALAGSTVTTLTADASAVAVGQSITLTATVTGISPTGNVTFNDGNITLGTAPVDASGQATLVVNGMTVGAHAITAVYSGDTNNAGSTSAAFTETVAPGGEAPAVASVVVNGGPPAYLDSFGLSVSLASQTSVVEQILVTFNEAVTLDPGAFTITNNAASVTVLGGPAPNTLPVNASFAVVPSSGSTQFIVTFSGPGTTAIPGGAGNVIDDGLYILNTIGSKVHANGQTAADLNTGFWALFGSAYAPSNTLSSTIGDGSSEVVVDSPAFNLFKADFGSESDLSAGPPAYDVSIDSNLDGVLDATDFAKFKNNFGADWVF